MSPTLEQNTQNGHAPESAPRLSPRVETPMERIERVKGYLYDNTLIKGEDYGLIPGTQGNKPSLLKPGAQKLCGLFQLAPIIKEVKRVMKDDFIAYEVTVQVTNKTSQVVEAEGAGTCNSRERKYKNKDAYDVANTLLKMAEKRALVGATLNALGISSLFTQDIEDFAPEVPAARAKEEKPQFEMVKDIPGMDNRNLRAWCDFVVKDCPDHPQKEAFKAEFAKRKKAHDSKQSEAPAPVAEAAVAATGPVDRWAAINAAAQGAKTNVGYMAFVAACNTRGISWASDDDVKAFEDAATPISDFPVVTEEIGDTEWALWAAKMASDELRLGA